MASKSQGDAGLISEPVTEPLQKLSKMSAVPLLAAPYHEWHQKKSSRARSNGKNTRRKPKHNHSLYYINSWKNVKHKHNSDSMPKRSDARRQLTFMITGHICAFWCCNKSCSTFLKSMPLGISSRKVHLLPGYAFCWFFKISRETAVFLLLQCLKVFLTWTK